MKVACCNLTCKIRYVEKRIDFIEFFKVLTTVKHMNIDDYWMWLTSIDLFGHKNIDAILNYLNSPEEVWNASSDILYSLNNISQTYIKKILDTRNEKEIESKLSLLEKQKIRYISIDNKEYPDKLKSIYDYPYGIYIKGSFPKVKKICIAIVGSRKCSKYGADVTEMLAKELALNNITIVSGLAKGIDCMSHKGAIKSDMEHSTIAVLGCGIDICYPKENLELMHTVIENGAVISEYPINTNPHPAFFPRRNRIISGLSEAVVIVEAARRSGSLITADQALEQGRDVFAVPGNITSQLSEGTNDLIRQGATLVSSSNDILDELGLNENRHSKRNEKRTDSEDFLAPDEKLVYDCISLEPLNIDIIFNKLDCPINKLQYILTLLELKGYILQLQGQRYVRNL